jgi:hypothetical protein
MDDREPAGDGERAEPWPSEMLGPLPPAQICIAAARRSPNRTHLATDANYEPLSAQSHAAYAAATHSTRDVCQITP